MVDFQTGAEKITSLVPCGIELICAPSSGFSWPSTESPAFFYLNYLWNNVGGAPHLGMLPSILLESRIVGKINLGKGECWVACPGQLFPPRNPSLQPLLGALLFVCHPDLWTPKWLKWKQQKLQGFPPCGFRELQTLSLDISLSSSTVLVHCLLSGTDLKKQPWDLGAGWGWGILLGSSRFRQSLRIFICHLHSCRIPLWPQGHFTE